MNIHTNISERCVPVQVMYKHYGDWTALPSVQITFGLLYSALLFLGITINSLVILIVIKTPELRSVRNIFIVCLSCSDIFVSMISLVISAITAFKKAWIFGEVLCYGVPLLQCMSIGTSSGMLTCIAIDRFILIVHPSWRAINNKTARIMIISVLLFSVSIALPAVFQMKLVNISGEAVTLCEVFCQEHWFNHTIKKAYSVSVLAAQFLIPFLVIGFCYAKISLALKKQSRFMNRLTNTRQNLQIQRNRRINYILISMCVVFGVCWCPYVLSNLLTDLQMLPEPLMDQVFFTHLVTHSLAMSSVVWNPFLYAWANENFKTVIVEMIPCLQDLNSGKSSEDFNFIQVGGKFSHRLSKAPGNKPSLDDRPVTSGKNCDKEEPKLNCENGLSVVDLKEHHDQENHVKDDKELRENAKLLVHANTNYSGISCFVASV